ncbi:MAG TPA: hypothetical protein VK968_07210, partial [Roseimicrobium sp.]|nr:hypothetical protein [Roseimicrobium sp.]
GLWHGASWNFVIWGAIHGGGLAVHRYMGDRKRYPALPDRVAKPISWALTLLFVVTAWVPFRSPSSDTTRAILERMYSPVFDAPVGWTSVALIYAIPLLLIADYGAAKWHQGRRLHLTRFWDQLAFCLLAISLLVLSPPASSPFIYFQF